jgi:thioredoxin-related protein
MQKVTRFFLAIVAVLLFASFSRPEKEKIQWLSIEEMHAAYKKQPKPILVDVYTSWCGWCKVMDKQTYTNDKLAAYINEKYYAVKFDAESKDSVEWNGKRYGYNPQNKVNDMAVYLMFGQMSYPTTVFLSELAARPAPLPGYLKPREMESPLKFFGDGVYKTKNFPEFMKSFTASW